MRRTQRLAMRDENGPAVPELARRATVSSCRHDPVRAFAPVLTAMPAAGIPPGDILADSGCAHRDADAWALPLRAAGASLVQDLHPHDRGPKGTHHGAIIANGSLYCPATPRPLLELGPLTRSATREQAATHDAADRRTARYKLGRITADDADGYHRVQCPAAMGKIRCPLRPASMTLDRDRPEILTPPEHPPACCAQQTITVPPDHRQDRAETRLPVRGAPPLLRPPHRRRTRLRHRQGPRHQRHQPRLVPPDGPGAPHARPSPACSSSATSASCKPGTPGRRKTSDAELLGRIVRDRPRHFLPIPVHLRRDGAQRPHHVLGSASGLGRPDQFLLASRVVDVPQGHLELMGVHVAAAAFRLRPREPGRPWSSPGHVRRSAGSPLGPDPAEARGKPGTRAWPGPRAPGHAGTGCRP